MHHHIEPDRFDQRPDFAREQRFRRLVSLFERDEIENAVEALIAELDARSGDPDLEDSEAGDPQVNACGRSLRHFTLADERHDASAEPVDPAWQEWSGRDPRRRRRAAHEPIGEGSVGEDAEADGDEQDHGSAEDDFCAHAVGRGPGCELSDPGDVGSWQERDEDGTGGPNTWPDDGAEDDNPAARLPHRERVRRTRCRHHVEHYGSAPPMHRWQLPWREPAVIRGAEVPAL